MTTSLYLGIDPGANGGLALIGGGSVAFKTMPKTDKGVYDWLRSKSQVVGGKQQLRCTIERVVPGFPGSTKGSIAKLYGSYRALCMALTACGIDYTSVMPVVWQRRLGIPQREKTEKKSQWKWRLKTECERVFPRLKVTLATCDALLIAEYCRRQHKRGTTDGETPCNHKGKAGGSV